MREYEIESSNIKKIGYDVKKKELIVSFKGGSSYAYQQVSPEAVTRLMFSDSVGREFHDSIKIKKAVKIG